MSGWESFFVAQVGASAAVAGLVFVGVSINLDKILKYAGLPGRAQEALIVLMLVLVVSSLMLVPGQRWPLLARPRRDLLLCRRFLQRLGIAHRDQPLSPHEVSPLRTLQIRARR